MWHRTHPTQPWTLQTGPYRYYRTAGSPAGTNTRSWGQTNGNAEPTTTRAQMYLGIRAGVRELPHFTPPVAERAHDRVCLAHLLSVTQQRVESTARTQPGHRNSQVAGSLTWGASCWRRPGHKGKLWPQWQRAGGADRCTSPATGSTGPPSPQSSSLQTGKKSKNHKSTKARSVLHSMSFSFMQSDRRCGQCVSLHGRYIFIVLRTESRGDAAFLIVPAWA